MTELMNNVSLFKFKLFHALARRHPRLRPLTHAPETGSRNWRHRLNSTPDSGASFSCRRTISKGRATQPTSAKIMAWLLSRQATSQAIFLAGVRYVGPPCFLVGRLCRQNDDRHCRLTMTGRVARP